MSTTAQARLDGAVILYDNGILPTLEPQLFEAGWLGENGYLRGGSRGRFEAHFIEFAGHELVLRHFNRGGLIGRFNRDAYFRTGQGRSRAMQEFRLLDMMRAQGLAVPRPVAARYAPRGLVYRADIITVRIPNARTLAEILHEQCLSEEIWAGIGAAIQKMHTIEVFHSDLNYRNIMIDDRGVVWLIDFDKCKQRAPGAWMQGNLDRLERSLNKAAAGPNELNWSPADWDALRAGYAS